MKLLKRYGLITFSIFVMAIGVYFFKFPNNFCFGGITGFAAVIAKVTPISASTFTFYCNIILLIVGLIFLGKNFAIDTGYASMLLSFILLVFEKLFPMSRPLSNEPMLELLFAITLPAIGTAILFNMGASSGGTDVIAMLFRKYTNVKNIGMALFISDAVMIIFACFVFDIKTALYSFVGLTIKSFMIDGIIESINMCKEFQIVCDNPEVICDFIVKNLNRSATVLEAKGAYTTNKKYIVMTALKRMQAVQLRQFIKENSPGTFIFISNTSEIIGKGFITI